MKSVLVRAVLAAAVVCATAGAAFAQATSTATDTKSFEILGVKGNTLVVRLPEGTRELTVADDFRFTVNGQQLSVQQLKAGMKGTATVTTRTTVTPVVVTEIKSGTVAAQTGDAYKWDRQVHLSHPELYGGPPPGNQSHVMLIYGP